VNPAGMVWPMPLIRIPEPFDHRDCLYEIKHDGFRALAHVEGHSCRLVSRRGHVFSKYGILETEISHSIRAHDAVLDGEIVCLDRDGRSNFYKLLFRRDWPYFFAFDLLSVDGEDLRALPLVERKRRLRRIMPRIESRLLYVDHVEGQGVRLFREACRRDLEGIVAKWQQGPYHSDGIQTSWLKIKNPEYSQMTGRRELFESRRDRDSYARPTRRWRAPILSLAEASTRT
jgi:bifunctional non-homologous end joining protein LigD